MSPDENRPTPGPDFADPGPAQGESSAPVSGPRFASPEPTRPRTIPTRGPQFADPEPAPPPAPAQPPVTGPEEAHRRPSSPVAKAIGWTVVLAVLGILASIYLPKEIPTFARKRPAETPAPPPVSQPVTPSNQVSVASAATVSPTQPTQAPSPTPRITTNPNALMSAEQVGRAMSDAESAERAGRDQALALFIALLRQPQFQNPEDFAVLKAHLGTVGISLIPGGASEGHHEIIDAIGRCATGADAARTLEEMGHEKALPAPVEQAILGVLASAATLPEIMSGVDKAQADTGAQLSPETIEVIRRHAQEAERARGTGAPGR